MSAVTAGGPGLVAVGKEGSGGAADAAVWTSPDAITWTRVPHDEAVFGGEGGQDMTGVTAGGPGLVAVGWEGSGGDVNAAVWTSPDGITWSRVPHDEAVLGGEGFQQMASVTGGGPGLVAVGRDNSDAAVWTSSDGITWSRVPHDEAVFGEGFEEMFSVIAGGPGLVAVGRGAAVWTSPDGITWSRVPHDAFGGDMTSVTVGGPGLVAVGQEGFGGGYVNAEVWTSPDGITWSRVPHDEAVFGGEVGQEMSAAIGGEVWQDQEMFSVTAGGPGLVAVGRVWLGSGFDAAVWTSSDGITWSRVPHAPVFGGAGNQRMASVIAGGPGLVVVGSDESGGDRDTAVWVLATEE